MKDPSSLEIQRLIKFQNVENVFYETSDEMLSKFLDAGLIEEDY